MDAFQPPCPSPHSPVLLGVQPQGLGEGLHCLGIPALLSSLIATACGGDADCATTQLRGTGLGDSPKLCHPMKSPGTNPPSTDLQEPGSAPPCLRPGARG